MKEFGGTKTIQLGNVKDIFIMNQTNIEEKNEPLDSNKSISDDTSNRITALRFLLSVLVVFIHNNYTVNSISEAVSNGSPEICFNPGFISTWVQLIISQGLATCAVPLFFMFSAYLQARKSDRYIVLLRKKFKTLFIPYVLWIGLYIVFSLIMKTVLLKLRPSIISNPDSTMLNWTIVEWIHQVFGYGPTRVPAAAAQFWFVRDLLILVLVSPIIKFLITRYKIPFLLFISILYCLSTEIYFVSTEALFFYVLGFYWGYYNYNLLEKIDEIKFFEIIILFLFCFITSYTIYENSTMTAFMHLGAAILLLKFSYIVINNTKVFTLTKYLSQFSFFLYAIHMPYLNEFLKIVWIHFFPMTNGFYCLFEYFGVTILTVFIGTILGIVLKKICFPIFKVLNGGR